MGKRLVNNTYKIINYIIDQEKSIILEVPIIIVFQKQSVYKCY